MGWCQFSSRKCHVPTGMVGVCSVTTSPQLQGTTTVVGACGRWWRTASVSSQHHLLFTSGYWFCFVLEAIPLLLLGSAGMGQAGRASSWFCGPTPPSAMAEDTIVLLQTSQALLLGSAMMQVGRDAFSRRAAASTPLTIQAVV